MREAGIGGDFKDRAAEPGAWQIGGMAFGEILPRHENKVTLDQDESDKWGLPVLAIDCETGENERLMREDMKNDMAEMLEAAGVRSVTTYDRGYAMGMGIHEMGTARMGNDPRTSVLNRWNQVWDAPNVFVTDGSCMVSASCVNPSLTYMALTARAVDYAVGELVAAQSLISGRLAMAALAFKDDLVTRREAIRRVSALLGGAALVGQSAWLAGCATELRAPRDVVLRERRHVARRDRRHDPARRPRRRARRPPASALHRDDGHGYLRPGRAAHVSRRHRDARARIAEQNGGGFMASSPAQRVALLERLDRETIEYMRTPGQRTTGRITFG